MTKNYSYDPGKIEEKGMDRMRFELGDTILAPGELTAALCDEEYSAIIKENQRWKKAKLKCLEAILMRFAHEVDLNVDGLSYSFAQRVDVWKTLLGEAQKDANVSVPIADPRAMSGAPYFYEAMNSNPRGCEFQRRK